MYYWVFLILGFGLGMLGIFPLMFGLFVSKFVAAISVTTPILILDYLFVSVFKKRPDLQVCGIVRPILVMNVGYTLAVVLFIFLFLRNVL